MRKKVNHTYNIQLTSLTPVSIGTSEVLSPYTDFVFDTSNKQIHLLDKRKIADRVLEVANDGTLMDEYVSFIRGTFDNNRSEFDLKAFLESKEKLDLDADDYAAQSIPYYGLNPNDRREIKSTLKNDRQPYISGSTLKGAMKACLLYDWFSEEAKESFNQLMQKTLRLYERCERDIRRLDQMAGKRYLSRDDRFKMRKIKDNIKRGGARNLAKDFDKLFAELLTEDHLFEPREFSLFKVGDTLPCSEESLIFQLTNRLHYNKGSVTIPANLEAIDADTTTEFRLAIEPKLQHPNLQFLNEEKKGLEALFKRINTFHKDNIDMELELLDSGKWYNEARPRERGQIEQYQAFLEDMYSKLDNALPNEAYCCVGFGKSFFYNSIGMLVYDWKDENGEHRNAFQKYCKLSFLGRDGQRHFPMTRTITTKGGAMGWVKMKIV